jgi:predicted dehydrogenase
MRAWAILEGAQIVAVCDTDEVKARKFGQAYGTAWFTDATAMLDQIAPDFTDIVTTVPSHRALVELAATRSKGIICQKPLALSLTDAEYMVAECEAASIPLLVHENFRWQAPIRAALAQVHAGSIGQPFFLRLNFRHAFDIYANQPYLAKTDNLALTDVGPHLFDMARAFMGDVSRVYCQTQQLNPRVSSPDAFLAQLTHAGGGLSTIECSFFSHFEPDRFPQTLLTIEGDRGSIEVLDGFRLRLHADGTRTDTSVAPGDLAWMEQPFHVVQESVLAFQRHAIEALNGTVEGQPTGQDNLRTFALTMAAIQSAASGESISLLHDD